MGSLQLLERVERKCVGTQGWVKRVRVTEGWDLNRSWVPSVRSREETSDKDRERDSASPSTGQHWWIKAPPDQTTDGAVQRRCHSVQMHTNGDSRPFLPSSLHTSREAWLYGINLNQINATDLAFGFFLTICCNFDRGNVQTESKSSFLSLGCVVKQVKLGSLFLLSTMLSFTWPRSSTPPSTHSRPTERFSAASAFQIRHSNTKNKPWPFTF